MAVGGGRRVSAWLMLACAIVAVYGVMLFASSVAEAERQIAELDEDRSRFEQTLTTGGIGVGVVAVALLLFIPFWIAFAVGSHRARKRGVPVESLHGIVAGIAGLGILLALLYATVAPGGPGMLAASIANGGGGAAGGVQLEGFEGNLTAANFPGGPQVGPMNAQNVHDFDAVSSQGTLNMRMVSGGEPDGLYAVAILEVRDPELGWVEVARTEPNGDSEVLVPDRLYQGDLRFRVTLPEGSFGGVQYGLFVAFDPSL